MNKHEAAKAQPGIEPNTNKQNRLNTPNDQELQVDWQKRQGNLHKESIQRGKEATRLKGGDNRD
jgi:hypothetical protein